MGCDRSEVHDNPTLVVGGAPSVEPALLLHRLERIGGPLVGWPRGLDVVVGVEKKCGSTLWRGNLGEHCRVASIRLQQLGVLEPGALEHPDDRPGRLVHLVLVVSEGADRRKSDQVAE